MPCSAALDRADRKTHVPAVPWRMSSLFPLNTLRTQRALTAASRLYGQAAVPAFALALYGAYWAEDRDITTDGLLRHVTFKGLYPTKTSKKALVAKFNR